MKPSVKDWNTPWVERKIIYEGEKIILVSNLLQCLKTMMLDHEGQTKANNDSSDDEDIFEYFFDDVVEHDAKFSTNFFISPK